MTTPSVNVSLGSGAPVPIPLLLDKWRSVTFMVALGECQCWLPAGHQADCKGRPVKVSCSISGKTWEESEVFDCAVRVKFPSPYEASLASATAACRARWALVKALVLGNTFTLTARFPSDAVDTIHRLHMQRDAVYVALCKMARAEEAALVAQQDVDEAFPFQRFYLSPAADHRRSPRPSWERFRAFVDYLVEQVSVLP